jgi:hypothetical protein
MKIKKFLISILLPTVFILAFPDNAFAQQYSLSISPPLVEIKIQPGKSLIKAFDIENNGEADLYLRSRIVPFEPKGELGKISLLDDDLTLSKLESEGLKFGLINVSPSLKETFLLRSGEKKQLVLKITALQTATEKDHYFTFLIEQTTKGEFISQSVTSTQAKIGSNVLLSVSESEPSLFQGQIADFKAVPRLTDIFDKVGFKTIIVNGGGNYFKINGGIEIKNWNGKTVKELRFRPDNVLTASKREAVCWQEEKETQIDCQFKPSWPGKYSAVLSFYPNDDASQVLTRQVVFWVLPIKIVIGLLVVSLFGWYILARVKENN